MMNDKKIILICGKICEQLWIKIKINNSNQDKTKIIVDIYCQIKLF